MIPAYALPLGSVEHAWACVEEEEKSPSSEVSFTSGMDIVLSAVGLEDVCESQDPLMAIPVDGESCKAPEYFFSTVSAYTRWLAVCLKKDHGGSSLHVQQLLCQLQPVWQQLTTFNMRVLKAQDLGGAVANQTTMWSQRNRYIEDFQYVIDAIKKSNAHIVGACFKNQQWFNLLQFMGDIVSGLHYAVTEPQRDQWVLAHCEAVSAWCKDLAEHCQEGKFFCRQGGYTSNEHAIQRMQALCQKRLMHRMSDEVALMQKYLFSFCNQYLSNENQLCFQRQITNQNHRFLYEWGHRLMSAKEDFFLLSHPDWEWYRVWHESAQSVSCTASSLWAWCETWQAPHNLQPPSFYASWGLQAFAEMKHFMTRDEADSVIGRWNVQVVRDLMQAPTAHHLLGLHTAYPSRIDIDSGCVWGTLYGAFSCVENGIHNFQASLDQKYRALVQDDAQQQ